MTKTRATNCLLGMNTALLEEVPYPKTLFFCFFFLVMPATDGVEGKCGEGIKWSGDGLYIRQSIAIKRRKLVACRG